MLNSYLDSSFLCDYKHSPLIYNELSGFAVSFLLIVHENSSRSYELQASFTKDI